MSNHLRSSTHPHFSLLLSARSVFVLAFVIVRSAQYPWRSRRELFRSRWDQRRAGKVATSTRKSCDFVSVKINLLPIFFNFESARLKWHPELLGMCTRQHEMRVGKVGHAYRMCQNGSENLRPCPGKIEMTIRSVATSFGKFATS